MPATELTNYGFHAEYNSSISADELFVNHSIPELRALEKRTSERYRDLIDAADSIVNMRHCALSIQEELHHMQDSCDVQALKRTVKAQINEDKKGTKESHKYLNASRLYLIAKLVYKNLQAHNEDTPFNVHFKAQILQKATLYLKVIEQSEQSLAETLCAIMLLDDVTKKDVFRKCLDMRTSALIQILEKSETKDTKSMVEQFKEMIRLIRGTVYHVGSVFISVDNEQSLFESCLHQLQQGFTVYEDSAQPSPALVSPRDSKASLTRLYSPSTNIHLLVRYLPESIQTFTPFLHVSGTRGQLSQEDITARMNLWIDQIVEQFHEKLDSLLSKVPCARELHELRRTIWEILKEDECVKDKDQSSSKKFPSKVHRTSLGTESVFKSRIELLVSGQTSFVNGVKVAFDKNLKDIKDDIGSVFISSENRINDLFLDKSAGDDLFNANSIPKNLNIDLFSDTENLSTFFQETIVNSVTSYRNQLDSLLGEVNTSDKNEDIQTVAVNNGNIFA
ncbi:12237_t:CDS:2 [Racocetra fulgida]|uniref:Conserved oligomeric Golgi complex subunit 1 n=1 Tax=Racocetra fulgida TaxID=60492 RepID=A0A9N8WG60_9GLOM|nr:12237_t:CDS:2 [Racocetra fulgida]